MALDELRENDEVYDVDEYKYVVDKNFLEKAKPITVDFNEMQGFKIMSNIELSSGCAGCGSTSSCG